MEPSEINIRKYPFKHPPTSFEVVRSEVIFETSLSGFLFLAGEALDYDDGYGDEDNYEPVTVNRGFDIEVYKFTISKGKSPPNNVKFEEVKGCEHIQAEDDDSYFYRYLDGNIYLVSRELTIEWGT